MSIRDVVDEINVDSVTAFVNNLQSFETRFLLSEKRFEAANWIKNQFEKMGFNSVELDSFECKTNFVLPHNGKRVDTTTIQVNVIATLEGKLNPEQIAIICGHYDSYSRNSNPFVEAPGADDNASGTTSVLESARAIMKTGYQPDYTIRFITFAAEELMYFGDAGSRIYANKCKINDQNIVMVINNDMIGYCEGNYIAAKCNIGHPDNFQHIEKVLSVASEHAAIGFNDGGYHGADLKSFLDNGFTGIYMEEALFNNNNYHQSSDLSVNINFNFMTEVIKAATAILISINQIITNIELEQTASRYSLLQNYPNPFNPATNITYNLNSDSQIELSVVDHLGRLVEVLHQGYKKAGVYSTCFNTNSQERELASGVYYLVLKHNDEIYTQKMLLIK